MEAAAPQIARSLSHQFHAGEYFRFLTRRRSTKNASPCSNALLDDSSVAIVQTSLARDTFALAENIQARV